MKLNPVTLHDGYKLDHRRQMVPGTEFMQSNFTPRASRRGTTHVVVGGIQLCLQKYFNEMIHDNFFKADGLFCDKDRVLNRFKRRIDSYSPGNEIGTKHIGDLFDLGYLPLQFNAFPEGTRVPIRVPILTVENTHPDFAWLVNFYETLLSSVIWPVCTSATTAYAYRKLLDSTSERTGYDKSFVPWQAHDFSFRGMMGPEAACLSALGHLFSFYGTDTLPVLDLVDQYYCGENETVIGGGIPATEHMVMCLGGQEDEIETFNRLLNLYPTGPVSVVSDTWNFWTVLTEILPQLKERIMSRDGKLIIRPDSGDPVKILCGDPDSKVPVINKGTIETLWDTFGGTKTKEGYKNLDSHIGAIYGDSITLERAKEIIQRLEAKGFCPTTALGIGSFTYQYVTRDTEGWAMKATWAQVNGVPRNLFKKPVTDDGTKFSAKGRLAVDENFNLIQCATPEQEAKSLLTPVWKDGKFMRYESLTEIRRRLHPDWELL